MPRNRLERQNTLTRRQCLVCFAHAGIGVCGGAYLVNGGAVSARGGLHEALFYKQLGSGKTQCMLCPNVCVRGEGEDGKCRARGNRHGLYYSLAYGRPCVVALDEVAKCPLYHFQAADKAMSIATAGCNLACTYCQNWEFSQAGPDEAKKSYELGPEDAVAKAAEHGADAMAYFYTEPTVYYEYMLDMAKAARRQGLKNIMVTAGYINPEPLEELLPHIDAVTLGLKGWNESFYREYVGGELGHVKATMRLLAQQDGTWWEVVNLIVPALNDNMDEVASLARWVRDTAGTDRPLHFTRFRPEYRLKRLPMTPAATLTHARETAMREGMKYVYCGNMPGHEGAHTYCPECGKLIIERLAFTVLDSKLNRGQCGYCGCEIGGIWS